MEKNSNFDKELKQYLHSIKTEIHSPQKSKFLKQLENSILLFVDEHDVESMDAIIEEFGSPKTIAASFLEEEDFDGIHEKIKMKQWISRIVALVVIILVAAIIVLGATHVIDTYLFNHGYSVETIGLGTPPPDSRIFEIY